jgi:Na+-driven multidrug efflux pump
MLRVGLKRGANDMHAMATAIFSAVAAAAGFGCSSAAVLWLCSEHMVDLTSVSPTLKRPASRATTPPSP